MTNEMKALVKARPEPGLWMETVPVPEPGPNDVLIRVRKSAICGTDVHIWNWDEWASQTVPVPMVVGHEFVGEIADTGSAATRYARGMRVSAEGHITCGDLPQLPGGQGASLPQHAGRRRAPAGQLRRICLRAGVERRADPRRRARTRSRRSSTRSATPCTRRSASILSARTCWSRAPGPIGIMGALVARRAGARKVVITDINPVRLDLARKVGIEHVVDVRSETLREIMPRIGMREGFDVGLEMSGAAPAFRDMIDVMNNGGKVAILGISPTAFEIDWNKVIFKMLTLKGIYGREIFETWYKMIAFVQGGLDVSPVITHRLPIDRFEEGFAAMRSGNSGKVVLDWGTA